MLAKNTLDRSAGLAGYLPDNRGGLSKPAAAIPEAYDFEDDDDIEEDEEQGFDARTSQVRGALHNSSYEVLDAYTPIMCMKESCGCCQALLCACVKDSPGSACSGFAVRQRPLSGTVSRWAFLLG